MSPTNAALCPEHQLVILRKYRDNLMDCDEDNTEWSDMETLRDASNYDLEKFARGENLKILEYLQSDTEDENGEVVDFAPGCWREFYEACVSIKRLEREIYDRLPKFHF